MYTIPRVYEVASNGKTATSYIWTSQNGTTTINHPNGIGINDTTVAITFTNGFTSSNITVQALNNCGVSGIRSLTVNRNSAPTPSPINGPTDACAYIGETGVNATYSVSPIAGVNSYTWTLPNGATNVSGQGTNMI